MIKSIVAVADGTSEGRRDPSPLAQANMSDVAAKDAALETAVNTKETMTARAMAAQIDTSANQ